jgi:Cu/Ag efflux pump CusA
VRSLIEIVVRFRILVIALAVGLLIAGVATLPRMHADILPESSPVTVDVQIEALGLSAPEVEELVTVPMEKNFFEGVMGVVDETSDSIPGMANIELHFAPGTNLYQARQLVQERLNSAFLLPNVSSPPTMIQPVSTTSDVELVGLTSKSTDIINLSVLARWTIVPKLLGLDGVANVSTYGQADRQLQVLVNPQEMINKHVALSDVITTVGNSQLVTPITYLQGSTPGTGGYLEDGNQRLDIRHILPFGSPGNLTGLPITGPGIPAGTTVGSVAQVQVGHQPLIGDAEVGGTQGLVLVIQKLPGANVTAVTNEVQQALGSLNLASNGINVNTTIFTQGTYASTAFHNVAKYAIIAAILAVIALLLLLLSLRTAFVAVVSIAVSLCTALLVLYALGNTINALLLLGLLLAAGVVAADAATGGLRRGMGAGLLVVLLAGVPLLVSSGTTALFLRPMVEAFMVTAAASMLVAATVGTALSSLLEKVGPTAPPRAVTALRERLAGGYRRSLRPLAGKAASLVIAGLCAVIAIAVVAGIPSLHPGQPTFQDRNLIVSWAAAPGTSLTEMNRLADVASSELTAIPGVQDVGATLGRAVTSDQIVTTNSGQLWVTMKPDANYGQTLSAIQQVADGTPGVRGTVSTYETDAMGGVMTAPPNEVVTRVYGPDYSTLQGLAGQVKSLMAGVPGVSSVRVQAQPQQPTIDVQVNLDAANKYGIAPGDIRREIAILVEGVTVGNFFQDQAVFDVTVQAIPDVRDSLHAINNLVIDGVNGQHVKVDQVASVSIANEQSDIRHQNTSLYLDVAANVSGRSVGAVASDVTSRLGSVSLPVQYTTKVLSGVQLDAGVQAGTEPGDTVVPGTTFPAFLAYVLGALLGIFLLGQAALGRWRLALAAFASLPVAMSGAMLVVYAGHWTGSLGAVAGLLAVFALAARQAIAVISRIREGHQDIAGAAAGAAGHAVTVAVVTAAVMAPFAIAGDKAGLELLWPAACVILGGLVTITLVSLYVLPVACLRLGSERIAPSPELDADEAPSPSEGEGVVSLTPDGDGASEPPPPVKEPVATPVGAHVTAAAAQATELPPLLYWSSTEPPTNPTISTLPPRGQPARSSDDPDGPAAAPTVSE